MIIHNTYKDDNGKERPLIQGSDAWHDMRAGRPTGSEFSKILTAKTCVLSKSHIGYMCKLVKESMFPVFDEGESFISEAMAHGILHEPAARKFYEDRTEQKVDEVGFITMDEGIAGASPDGLIYNPYELKHTHGLEIKCPQPETHIRYVYENILPNSYKPQVHFCMAVTGLKRWDFLSYHPDMKHLLVEVHWDEYTDKVVAALEDFTVRYADFRENMLPKLKTEPKPEPVFAAMGLDDTAFPTL